MEHHDTHNDVDKLVASELQSCAAPNPSVAGHSATNVELFDTKNLSNEASTTKPSGMFVETAHRQSSSSSAVSELVAEQKAWEAGITQQTIRPRSDQHSRPWHTTLLRAGPISGIFSMFLAIACIFACLGVLKGSNGAAVNSWSVQPSLYVAVFTTVANLSMRYACIQGIVIAWWTRALRGSTVSQLHWDWRSGTTLVGALTGGRRMGWFGLACIFSTLVTVDGPLLQRATHVVRAPITGESVPLNITVAAEIPQFYGGHWVRSEAFGSFKPWSRSFNKTVPTVDGPAPNDVWARSVRDLTDRIIRQDQTDAPLVGMVHGCHGTCKTTLKAPTFAPSCELHRIPVNYSQPTSQVQLSTLFLKGSGAMLHKEGFMVSSSLVEGDHETVNLITAWSTTNNCVGILNFRVCTLASAVGEYNISINGDRATLDNAAHPKIVALANNTQADHSSPLGLPGSKSTFAAIVEFMAARWESFVAFYEDQGTIQTPLFNEDVAATYAVGKYGCVSFMDPYESIMANLNKVMVFVGVQAARENASYLQTHMDPGWPLHTKAVGTVVGDHNVYKSEFRFFIAAVVIELACILLVAPTYWGWWHLGRPCSFSPLEVAKAFESPLLADANSNSSGRDLAGTVGEVRVRYGATSEFGMPAKSKLAFANPVLVDQPEKRTRFDL